MMSVILLDAFGNRTICGWSGASSDTVSLSLGSIRDFPSKGCHTPLNILSEAVPWPPGP